MRRPYWLLLVVIVLAACNAPSITINVQPPGGAPTATSGAAPTASVAVAYRATQPPEVVHLPTGPTPTAMTGGPAAAFAPAPASATMPPRAPAGYRPAAIGQAVGAWGWSFRCTGKEEPRDGLAWSAVGNRLQALGTWVVVALDLTNAQPDPQAIRADEFAVRDGRLRAFGPTAALGAGDYSAFRGGQRFGEPVPPGATARYYLAFDLPADASGLRLVLASRPVVNGFEVSFDLGR